MRRLVLVWACSLITYAVIRTFENLPEVTAPVTSALVAVIGILATVIGLYRERDDGPQD